MFHYFVRGAADVCIVVFVSNWNPIVGGDYGLLECKSR